MSTPLIGYSFLIKHLIAFTGGKENRTMWIFSWKKILSIIDNWNQESIESFTPYWISRLLVKKKKMLSKIFFCYTRRVFEYILKNFKQYFEVKCLSIDRNRFLSASQPPFSMISQQQPIRRANFYISTHNWNEKNFPKLAKIISHWEMCL